MIRFTGQAAHSGSTPIPMRRDAFLAAAQTALECRAIAPRHSKPGARRRLHGRRRERRAEDRDGGAGRVRDLARSARARRRRARRDAARRARGVGAAARENNVTVEWTRLVANRAASVRSGAAATVRGSGARGDRRRAAAAVGAAARRRRDGAAHAGRHDVRRVVERPVALQGRGHAGAAAARRPSARTCDWSRRRSPTSPHTHNRGADFSPAGPRHADPHVPRKRLRRR